MRKNLLGDEYSFHRNVTSFCLSKNLVAVNVSFHNAIRHQQDNLL